MYQVGRAQSPEETDQVFELIGDATQAAEKLSIENDDIVFAVWELMDHDAPYTAYLYYQGEMFKNGY
jgi:hypothetical protein